VDDLYRYWGESPPTHELVAAYLGYKGGGSSESKGDGLEMLMGMSGVRIDPKLMEKA
jgi:hypothetical protein